MNSLDFIETSKFRIETQYLRIHYQIILIICLNGFFNNRTQSQFTLIYLIPIVLSYITL